MIRARRWTISLALALVAASAPAPAPAQAADGIRLARPGQDQFVRDGAEVLVPADAASLTQAARKLLTDSGHTLLVVTIESLADLDAVRLKIDGFTRRLHAQWSAPGENLVLLVLSRLDGQAWIEPPASWDDKSRSACRDLVQQHMAHHLRKDDHDKALLAGAEELVKLAGQVEFASRVPGGRPGQTATRPGATTRAATGPAGESAAGVDGPAFVIGSAATLRCLASGPGRCVWAAGDRGMILKSDDGGATWRCIQSPLSVHLQSIGVDGARVYLFGGRNVSGQWDGAGQAAILRSDDGLEFRPVPSPPGGWLYGGAALHEAILTLGQASPQCPGGVWRSVSGGKTWKPVGLSTAGYVRGGGFLSARLGYAVGAAERVVSLRGLAEPATHPPETPSREALRAAGVLDAETAFAAGDNGTVLASREAGRPWRTVTLPMPLGTRRLTDLEAVATALPGRVWIGGGLTGSIFASDNRGATWQRRPAPAGGCVRAMLHLPAEQADGPGTLLACGDGGRIWRSVDEGRTWTQVLGPQRTDVLFVAAAGDRSIFPAVAAHALAGLDVAVVFATDTADLGAAPADQHLRAAAIQAGASAVTVLSDFPSVLTPTQPDDLREDEILRRWSDRLDGPADREMTRQIAAAIRMYRPSVLAIGPHEPGPGGIDAENRLVARLAQQAVAGAGDEKAHPELTEAGLPGAAVRRIVTGYEENQQATMFWEPAAPPERTWASVWLTCSSLPAGKPVSLDLLAQEALWQLPWTGALDRPGLVSAYRCAGERRLGTLFTRDLADGRFTTDAPEPAVRDLAAGLTLRLASVSDQAATAFGAIAKAAQQFPASAPLAADRAMLLWLRLLQQGKIVQADEAFALYDRLAAQHPLRQRIRFCRLAQDASAEWRAARREAIRPDDQRAARQEAVRTLSTMPAWTASPAGRLLLARAMNLAMRQPEATDVLTALADANVDPGWQRLARLAAGIAPPSITEAAQQKRIFPPALSAPGKLDGYLEDEIWLEPPRTALLLGDGKPPTALLAGREGPKEGKDADAADEPSDPPPSQPPRPPAARMPRLEPPKHDQDAQAERRKAEMIRLLQSRRKPAQESAAPDAGPRPPDADPSTQIIRLPGQPKKDDISQLPREKPRPRPEASLQVARTAAGFLVFALRLPSRPERVWTVDLAFDSDNDGSTQLVIGCDTLGKRWARLEAPGGVWAGLDAGGTFLIQGQDEQGLTTLEIALPVAQLGLPAGGGPCGFQLRAVAKDYGTRTTLYLQPQEDTLLLPHRYGLLQVPPAPPPAERAAPALPATPAMPAMPKDE